MDLRKQVCMSGMPSHNFHPINEEQHLYCTQCGLVVSVRDQIDFTDNLK